MKNKLDRLDRPGTSSLLAWISVALAGATFVILTVSLIFFVQQSEERSAQLQAATESNQDLLREVRRLVRVAREEGEQRRLDIRALARRLEELHDSDPSNSPFEPRGEGEKGDDETSDAGPEGSGGGSTPNRPPKTPNRPPHEGGNGPSGKPPKDDKPQDEPEDPGVCLPVVGCVSPPL